MGASLRTSSTILSVIVAHTLYVRQFLLVFSYEPIKKKLALNYNFSLELDVQVYKSMRVIALDRGPIQYQHVLFFSKFRASSPIQPFSPVKGSSSLSLIIPKYTRRLKF